MTDEESAECCLWVAKQAERFGFALNFGLHLFFQEKKGENINLHEG